MKRILMLVAAFVAALGATTAAAATDGHPITEKALGVASVPEPYSIRVRNPADVLVATATVPRGASFGWHYHRSAAVVVVQTGTLTLYDSTDPSCTPRRYSAGQGFVEHANHIHLARNEGGTKAVVLVTYLGLPHGVNPDVPVPSPGNCPF